MEQLYFTYCCNPSQGIAYVSDLLLFGRRSNCRSRSSTSSAFAALGIGNKTTESEGKQGAAEVWVVRLTARSHPKYAELRRFCSQDNGSEEETLTTYEIQCTEAPDEVRFIKGFALLTT